MANKRGQSSINSDVGSVPAHAAVGYLDYLCTTEAPVHSKAPLKTPAEVQAAADTVRHCPPRVLVGRGVQNVPAAAHHGAALVRREGYQRSLS